MAANELRTLLRNEGGGRVHLVPTAWGAQTHAKLVAGDSRTHWGHREAPTRPHRLSEDGRHVSCKRSNTGCFWVSQESAGGDTGQALLECRRKIASNTLLNLQISHPSGGRAGKFLCILFMWWLWGGDSGLSPSVTLGTCLVLGAVPGCGFLYRSGAHAWNGTFSSRLTCRGAMLRVRFRSA